MTTAQQVNAKNQNKRTVAELVADIELLTQEIQELYLQDRIPWVIGYSGGKDSTAILQLVWNAIAQLPKQQRSKTIHVITTDTLVENPYVSIWVKNSLKQIEVAAYAGGKSLRVDLGEKFSKTDRGCSEGARFTFYTPFITTGDQGYLLGGVNW
ncbi:hypothetical protein NIES3974_29110 [Calothrix sp. NIES-3974]|nr:hypothetical protein NIES3974_29110 [Calothrix sp. NIES-3974]